MASYEKQQKQEAEYPIPVSLFPMAHCPAKIYKDYRYEVDIQPLVSISDPCHPYIDHLPMV